MQRQSLGSPLSKLHTHGVAAADDPKCKGLHSHPDYDDSDLHRKTSNSRRLSSSSSSTPLKSDKLVHFIPLLTLLCFLLLYLVSHTPSQSDMAQFKLSTKPIDSAEINLRRGGVLAIRSLRNLQEVAGTNNQVTRKSRLHRKIADF